MWWQKKKRGGNFKVPKAWWKWQQEKLFSSFNLPGPGKFFSGLSTGPMIYREFPETSQHKDLLSSCRMKKTIWFFDGGHHGLRVVRKSGSTILRIRAPGDKPHLMMHAEAGPDHGGMRWLMTLMIYIAIMIYIWYDCWPFQIVYIFLADFNLLAWHIKVISYQSTDAHGWPRNQEVRVRNLIKRQHRVLCRHVLVCKALPVRVEAFGVHHNQSYSASWRIESNRRNTKLLEILFLFSTFF